MGGPRREGGRGVPQRTAIATTTSGVATRAPPRVGAPRAAVATEVVAAPPRAARVARPVQRVAAPAASATQPVAARPQGPGVPGSQTKLAARPPQGATPPTRVQRTAAAKRAEGQPAIQERPQSRKPPLWLLAANGEVVRRRLGAAPVAPGATQVVAAARPGVGTAEAPVPGPRAEGRGVARDAAGASAPPAPLRPRPRAGPLAVAPRPLPRSADGALGRAAKAGRPRGGEVAELVLAARPPGAGPAQAVAARLPFQADRLEVVEVAARVPQPRGRHTGLPPAVICSCSPWVRVRAPMA